MRGGSNLGLSDTPQPQGMARPTFCLHVGEGKSKATDRGVRSSGEKVEG